MNQELENKRIRSFSRRILWWVIWVGAVVVLGWWQYLHWDRKFDFEKESLLKNTSFQRGLEDWDIIGDRGVSLQKREMDSIVVLETNDNGEFSGRSVYVNQEAKLNDELKYVRVSVDLRGVELEKVGDGLGLAMCEVIFKNQNGQRLQSIGVSVAWMSEDRDWRRYDVVYACPDGTKSIEFQLENRTRSGKFEAKRIRLVEANLRSGYNEVGIVMGLSWVIVLGLGFRRMFRLRSIWRGYLLAGIFIVAFWGSCYPGIRQEYRPLLWSHFPKVEPTEIAFFESLEKKEKIRSSEFSESFVRQGKEIPMMMAGVLPLGSISSAIPYLGFSSEILDFLDWVNRLLPGIGSGTQGLHVAAFFAVGLLACIFAGTSRVWWLIALVGILSEVFQYFKLGDGDISDVFEAMENVFGALLAGFVWWSFMKIGLFLQAQGKKFLKNRKKELRSFDDDGKNLPPT